MFPVEGFRVDVSIILVLLRMDRIRMDGNSAGCGHVGSVSGGCGLNPALNLPSCDSQMLRWFNFGVDAV